MLKKVFSSAVIVLLLATTAGAQTKTKTALELNNEYSSVSDSLFVRGTAWGGKLNEVMTSGEYSQLKPLRLEMEQFIERKRKDITASAVIGGSEKFKAAMLNFLKFEKEMVTNTFQPFEKLTASSKTEEVQALLGKVTTNSQGEQAVLLEVQKTQEEYAKRNGFTIETAPAETK